MAQIVATFDTVEKTLAVTFDGKTLQNLECVRFDRFGGDEFMANITTMAIDDTHETVTYTQVMASEAPASPGGIARLFS